MQIALAVLTSLPPEDGSLFAETYVKVKVKQSNYRP
jgi:hypothetical protein